MFLSVILYSLGQACNIGLKFKKYIRVFRIDLAFVHSCYTCGNGFSAFDSIRLLKCVMGIVVKSVERIVKYTAFIFQNFRRIKNEKMNSNAKRTTY